MKTLQKIKEIYKQDGKAFAYHLAGVGISTAVGAATAGCLEDVVSCGPVVNSSITTAVGSGSYWFPFLGLLANSEKNEMKNEQGKYDRKKVAAKTAQYASLFGLGELFYAGLRGVVQYHLQERFQMDAAYASALTDLTCATAYGLVLPPVRHLLRKIDRTRRTETPELNEKMAGELS